MKKRGRGRPRNIDMKKDAYYRAHPEERYHPNFRLGARGEPAKNKVIPLRVTAFEFNAMHNIARATRTSATHLIRVACQLMYPDVFEEREYAPKRKKKPPKPLPTETIRITSLATGKTDIVEASALNSTLGVTPDESQPT